MKEFLAEWSPIDGVMLALPHEETDWNYILEEAEEQYRRIIGSLVKEGIHVVVLCKDRMRAEQVIRGAKETPGKGSDKKRSAWDLKGVTFIEVPFNDTWTRDYGPLTILKHGDLRGLDFGFNGWGLKFAADKDNQVNRRLNELSVFNKGLYRNETGFILEGGSVDTDGEGTVLTTTRCLCSPNRNGYLNKKEADGELRKRLGAEHVLFLDFGELEGDDTDSHIDTLARMAPDNIILFTGCRNVDDPQFEGLFKMRAQLSMFRNKEGLPYNLVELPLPDAIYDEEGHRLPATYANYLVTEDVIFMPTYAQPQNDELAKQTVRIAFPGHRVVGVDCRTLIKQHGSLHCATMQLPRGLFNPVVFEV
ncbi:MAG: agmatine deiminase family protein [Muribaculaceae bacterium]|nr:agmatine deiminase family protein [Muribaculaceae bacterium]